MYAYKEAPAKTPQEAKRAFYRITGLVSAIKGDIHIPIPVTISP